MSNEFKSWDELTPLEQAQGIYWDMYKEPRPGLWKTWRSSL